MKTSDKPGSSISLEELMRLDAELAARVRPSAPPHPDRPPTPATGSNVAYLPPAENARLVQQALAAGLGHFGRMSAHEVHLLAARMSRPR